MIRAEKGNVRMLLYGKSDASQKELVYDARKDIDNELDQTRSPGLRPVAEDNCDALDLERGGRRPLTVSVRLVRSTAVLQAGQRRKLEPRDGQPSLGVGYGDPDQKHTYQAP